MFPMFPTGPFKGSIMWVTELGGPVPSADERQVVQRGSPSPDGPIRQRYAISKCFIANVGH